MGGGFNGKDEAMLDLDQGWRMHVRIEISRIRLFLNLEEASIGREIFEFLNMIEGNLERLLEIQASRFTGARM